MAASMKAMGFEVPKEKLRMAGCGSYADVMNTLERAVSENRFIAGDLFTAADVYVGAHVGWGYTSAPSKRGRPLPIIWRI